MRDKADAWQMEITSMTWEYEKTIKKQSGLVELNFKPGPGSWSIGEILSHLIQVNSSYFPIFDQVIAGTYQPPFLGKLPFYVNAVGSLLKKSMNSKSKVKTFALWEPKNEEFRADILIEFSSHQMELSSYIQQLEPFLSNGTVIHSPANRFLVYSLEKAIEIIIAHEKRHLQQCKNILEELSQQQSSL